MHNLAVFFTILVLSGCFYQADKPDARDALTLENLSDAQLDSSGSKLVVSQLNGQLSFYPLSSLESPAWQTILANGAWLNDFSNNGEYWLSASEQSYQLFYQAQQPPQALLNIQLQGAKLRDIALGKDGQHIALAFERHIYVKSLLSGQETTFNQHSAQINSISLSQQGVHVLSGADDYLAYYWRVIDRQIVYRFIHQHRIVNTALSQDGKWAFTMDSKSVGKIWQLENGRLQSRLVLKPKEALLINQARFSEDGQYLLTASAERKLDIWHVATGLPLKRWQVTGRADDRLKRAVVYSGAFLPASNQVVSVSSSGLVEYWSLPLGSF